MAQEELPDNYVKEVDPEGRIIFFNKIDKKSTYQHPSINKFRQIFYEKKFKEDEIDLFRLENRKNIPAKFSHQPIISYGDKDSQYKDLMKIESTKELPAVVVNKTDGQNDKGKEQAGKSRYQSKSIYKKQSISSKITKSIGGMGDLVKQPQKEDQQQNIKSSEKYEKQINNNSNLMFTEVKIVSLNPKVETIENRYKEMMNELSLMKETEVYKLMKERIYPNIEDKEVTVNIKKQQQGNKQDNENKLENESGLIIKTQDQVIPNVNIYHNALLTSQKTNLKKDDKKGIQKSGQVLRSGLGLFTAQQQAGKQLSSMKNIGNTTLTSNFELSESFYQNPSTVQIQEDKESVTQNDLNDKQNVKKHDHNTSKTSVQNEQSKQNLTQKEGNLEEQYNQSQKIDFPQIDIYCVRMEKQNTIEVIEKELFLATLFYEDKYGKDYFIQQQIIEQQKSYLRANPEDVILALKFLNIQLDQSKIFWVARAFASLDLPDFWTEVYDQNMDQIVYVNQLTNFHFNLHPCIIFVQKIIQRYKSQNEQEVLKQAQQKFAFKPKSYLFTAEVPKQLQQVIKEENNAKIKESNLEQSNFGLFCNIEEQYMTFENRIGKSYTVNLTKLSQKLDKINIYKSDQTTIPLTSKLEYITNTLNNIRRKEAKQGAPNIPYFDDAYFQLDNDLDDFDENIYYEENIIEMGESKHRRQNSNLSDQHMLILSNELGLKFPDDMHILILVHEFLEYKESNANHNWRFRCKDQNTFYWFSPKDQKSQIYYPHLSQLKDVIQLFQRSLKRDIQKIKINKKGLKFLKMFDHSRENIYSQIKKESKEFVEKYIQSQLIGSEKKKNEDNSLYSQFEVEMISMSSSEEDNKSITESVGSNQSKDLQKSKGKKQKFENAKQDGYQLKYVLDILRNKSSITEKEIKEKVLFNWPLKFQYKENEIKDLGVASRPQIKKHQQAVKHKQEQSIQLDTLSKLDEVPQIQSFVTQSTSSTINGGLHALSTDQISTIVTKKKNYPPTSFQVIQNPQHFFVKTNQDLYRFNSGVNDSQSSKSSSSLSSENSLKDDQQSINTDYETATELQFFKHINQETIAEKFFHQKFHQNVSDTPQQNLLKSQEKKSSNEIKGKEEEKEKEIQSQQIQYEQQNKQEKEIESNQQDQIKNDGLINIENLTEKLGENTEQEIKQINDQNTNIQKLEDKQQEEQIQPTINPEQNVEIKLLEVEQKEKNIEQLINSIENQEFEFEPSKQSKQNDAENISQTVDSAQIQNESTQADISHEMSKIFNKSKEIQNNNKQQLQKKLTSSSTKKSATSEKQLKLQKKTSDKKGNVSPLKSPGQQKQGILKVKAKNIQAQKGEIKQNAQSKNIVQQLLKDQSKKNDLVKKNNEQNIIQSNELDIVEGLMNPQQTEEQNVKLEVSQQKSQANKSLDVSQEIAQNDIQQSPEDQNKRRQSQISSNSQASGSNGQGSPLTTIIHNSPQMTANKYNEQKLDSLLQINQDALLDNLNLNDSSSQPSLTQLTKDIPQLNKMKLQQQILQKTGNEENKIHSKSEINLQQQLKQWQTSSEVESLPSEKLMGYGREKRDSLRWRTTTDPKKNTILNNLNEKKPQQFIIQPKINEIAKNEQKLGQKQKIEDSYKSLFENNFKDRAKQMNLFNQQNKSCALSKYIKEEFIIQEVEDEDDFNQFDDNLLGEGKNGGKNFILKQIYMTGQQQKRGNPNFPNNDIQNSSNYINYQLRNQYYQTAMLDQKITNEISQIDQFNTNFLNSSNQKISPTAKQQLAPIIHNQKYEKNNIIQTNLKPKVRQILVFPTLQQPTKNLIPHISPKIRLIKTSGSKFFHPNRSLSPKNTQAENDQSSQQELSIPIIKSISDISNPASRRQSRLVDGNQQRSFNTLTPTNISKSLSPSPKNNQRSSIVFGQNKNQKLQIIKYDLTQSNKIQESTNVKDILSRKDNALKLVESKKLKDQLENINKYQDDYTNYKLKQMLSDLLKNMPYVKFDFQQKINSKIQQIIPSNSNSKINSYKIFQIEAQAHLELIKIKFLKKKLDLIAFDFIMLNLQIPKVIIIQQAIYIISQLNLKYQTDSNYIQQEAKKTIYDSEILKARLFRKFRNFFKDIRNYLINNNDVFQNLQRIILDQNFEMKLLSKLFNAMKIHFQRQIIKINKENVFQQIILFQENKKVKQIMNEHNKEQQEEQKNQDEELAEEVMLSDIDSDPEEQNDLNPFSQQFSLVNTKILQKMISDDKKKQRKRRKLIKRLEKGKQFIDSDEEKEYEENIKQYHKENENDDYQYDKFEDTEQNLQNGKKKPIIHIDQLRDQIDQENERKIKKERKKEKKQIYQEEEEDDEDEEYDAFDGETQKKRRRSIASHDSNFKNDNNSENSSSDIQSDTESSMSDDRLDTYQNRLLIMLKVFVNPKFIFLFQQFLETQERICTLEEQNKTWKLLINQLGHVHTLFRDCMKRVEVFLDYGFTTFDFEQMIKRLNIDPYREGDLLWIPYFYCGVLLRFSPNKNNEVLQAILQSKEKNDYDSYFIELIELNRVKRQFVIIDMNIKNQSDYITFSQWFKFYSKKNGSIFFYNPILKKKVENISQKIFILQEQFRAIEKYKFIEMVDFIMNKIKDEEEKDISMQFNIMFQNPKKDVPKSNQKKSILEYKYRNSVRGSIRSVIESNQNIFCQINDFIKN